jgi:hypothetical protein
MTAVKKKKAQKKPTARLAKKLTEKLLNAFCAKTACTNDIWIFKTNNRG